MFSRRFLCTMALSAGYLTTIGTAHAEQSVNPYTQPNNTWISINGTVKSVSRDTFQLDFGESTVLVEMDDGDRDADGYKLMEGDNVTVNGRIDDDFFETTSIEANSVYVKKLNTYFYASPIDEEDRVDYSAWYEVPVFPDSVSIQGYVTSVDDSSFTINTGTRLLTVDVDKLPYDPLDDKGYVMIDKGDVVRVRGKIDDSLFSDRVLEASAIAELYHAHS